MAVLDIDLLLLLSLFLFLPVVLISVGDSLFEKRKRELGGDGNLSGDDCEVEREERRKEESGGTEKKRTGWEGGTER